MSNTCSGSFRRTSSCFSKEKETRKCNFSLYKIFLKQIFFNDIMFRRLKVKQELKSRECDVPKTLNFLRFPGTSLNKRYGRGGLENFDWDTLPPSWKS